MALALSIAITYSTQPWRSPLDRMSTTEFDNLIAGDARRCAARSMFQHAVNGLGAKPGNKANPLFCKLAKPLVVDIAFVKRNHAALGKRKFSPLNHIVFLAITQRNKLRNRGGVIQPYAEFYIGSVIAMSGPGELLQR